MALASKSVPNLINGVSQQPPELRLNNQLELQENGYSDVVEGLKKRPPTQFVKNLVRTNGWSSGDLSTNTINLTASELSDAFLHTYKRDDAEQYTIAVIPQESSGVAQDPILLVYDIDGNLRYEAGKASWNASGTHIADNTDSTTYLKDLKPKDILKATSVADTTFIVNTDTTTSMDAEINPPALGSSALVHFKTVNYKKDYTLRFEAKNSSDVIEASASTDDPSSNTHYEELKVSTTAKALRDNLITNTSINASDENSYFSSRTEHKDFYRDGNLPALSLLTYTRTDGRDDTGALQTETAFYNGDDANKEKLIVVVGDNAIPYSSSDQTAYNSDNTHYPTAGWIYNNTTTRTQIILPTSIIHIEEVYRYKGRIDVDFNIPSVNVYEPTTNVNLVITPSINRDEGYFIVTAPEYGTFGDFDVIATDDNGGNDLVVVKDFASKFTDLPNQCTAGYRTAVVGDGNKAEDDFYVVFDGSGGSGVWRETVKSGLQNKLKSSTMPHSLTQNSDLSFTFDNQTWNTRSAGDDITNPQPSFIDNKINDVFFYRNRLAFLSQDNVIFSENGEYNNFFRTTVRTLLDSDPIDISISQTEVSTLKAATPIQDYLVLFSEQNQFTLSSAQLLTATDVKADLSTSYQCSLKAKPVAVNNSVYFATKNQFFSGVREYVTNPSTEINEAALITNHVPEYIEGTITKFAASSNKNLLLCLNDQNKKNVYVYKFYDSDNQRVQSAWSTWTFDTNVVDIYFNNSKLFIIFEDGNFEKLELASNEASITFSETESIDNVSPSSFSLTLSGGDYTYLNFVTYSYQGTNYTNIVKIDLTSTQDTIDITVNRNLVDVGFAGITFNSVDYNISDAVVSGSSTDSTNRFVWTLTTSQSDDIKSVYNSQFTLPLRFTVSTSFASKGYDVYLDHRRKLNEAGSAGFTLSDIPSSELSSTTKFVDHLGRLIATGTTTAELNKVVDFIDGNQHVQDGVSIYNYVYAGEPYTFKFQLSEPVFEFRERDTTTLARTQLRTVSFSFTDTAFFNFKVKAKDREETTTAYTAKEIGNSNNKLGFTPNISHDSKKFGVLAEAKNVAITVENDSYLPSTFQSAEYEIMFHYRPPRRL